MSHFEFERKFTVKSDEWNKLVTHSIQIEQHYICINDTSFLRIRSYGQEKFELTVKARQPGAARFEIEFLISAELYESMLSNSITNIKKRRYYLGGELAGWVVDEMHHPKQMVLAEFESNESEVVSLDLPNWIASEVTDDPSFQNYNISMHTD